MDCCAMVSNLSKKSGTLQKIVIGAAIGAGLAFAFAGGFLARDVMGAGLRVNAAVQTAEYPLLAEVQALLDHHYLREQPDTTQRQYAAIRGMLGILGDPYTFFIDPPVAASESDVLAGTYGGIGVEIQRNELGEIVLYPFDDSPAKAAGIETGDVLLSVNGSALELTTGQDSIDQLLRGEVKDGNGVQVVYRRLATGEEVDVFIPFGVINVPSVIWRVLAEDERIGYMHVLRFTSRTPDEVRTAIAELSAAGVEGLALDLRNNAGGLLAESIAVADEFLDGGVLAYETNRAGEEVFNAQPGGAGVEYPLVVLVNRGTASGAELVAGALRDRERGILIGQQTYGKGTVQQIYLLADRSSLHVTAAEWFTPARTPLDGQGLEPNIAMIPDENGRDVELGEAVRQLAEQIAQ
jgi:carboxyl-terminal processing protease